MILLKKHKVDLFLETLQARPAAFFATNVKSLCMDYSVPPVSAAQITYICTGIVNLATWSVGYRHAYLSSHIAPLYLRHICFDFDSFLGLVNVAPDTWYGSITHLNIFNYYASVEYPTIPNLIRFATLTHLHIGFRLDGRSLHALSDILITCETLKVLVLAFPTPLSPPLAVYLEMHGLHDPRVVAVGPSSDMCKEWEASVDGIVDDQWVSAARIVEAQQVDNKKSSVKTCQKVKNLNNRIETS